MLAEQFIDRLEQQGLLDAKVVRQLRRKLDKVKDRKKITAEQIARLLVDAGHLTQFQATKLVAELTTPKESAAVEVGATRQVAESDELAFKPSQDDLEMEVKTSEPAKSPSKGFRPPPVTKPAPAASPPPAPAESLLEDLVETDGLTDLPADDGLGGVDPLTAPAPSGGVRTRLGGPVIAAPTSVWDSKLLLVGGGVLGVLAVVGVFLYFALTAGKAADLFEQAEKAYKEGSYAQAAKLYEKLLKDYPRFEQASLARVKTVTAKLRQTYQTPKEGLRVAKEDLPTIKKEEAFEQARPELASMLPDIAAALIDTALKVEDVEKKKEYLQLCKEAMKLVNDPEYIPTSLRQSRLGVINRTRDNIEAVQRAIEADQQLRKTVAEIESAAESGDTGRAYEIRRRLVEQTVGNLANHPDLIAAMQKVAAKERELVRVESKPLTASTEDHAGADVVRVILSAKQGQPVSGVAGEILFLQVKGTVFALEAASGNVLWTRFLGLNTSPFQQPQMLDPRRPGSDCLVVDPARHELLRLDAKSGKLKWRLTVGRPFAPPAVTEEAIYVTTREGKLYEIDPETGNSDRYVQLPSPTRVAATVDVRRNRIFQIADHDTIYVLDRESLQCLSVYYLGHDAGTVLIEPTVILGHLLVAKRGGKADRSENDQSGALGARFTLVYIMRLDKDGKTLKQVQTPLRLRGWIEMPMESSRRRLLITTDLGEVVFYDIDLNSPDHPVERVAARPSTGKKATRLAVFDRGYLWLAEDRLFKYQVQASRARLPQMGLAMEGDEFFPPLLKRGEVIYTVRRREGARGLTVAAIPASDNQLVPRWEVELGEGASYLGVAANGQLNVLTPFGQLFRVDPRRVRSGAMVSPTASVAMSEPASVATQVGTALVFTGRQGYQRAVILEPGEQVALRDLTLNIQKGQATAPASGFQNGLLVPLKSGEVVLLDLKRGSASVAPFHPPVAAGQQVTWGRAAVFPDGKEFVIADNRRQLFKVGVKARPRRNLAEVAAAELQDNLRPQLAATDDRVYGVQSGAGADTLIVFRRKDLGIAAELPFDGAIEWGPSRFGDLVLMATSEELIAVRGDRVVWTTDSPAGLVAGVSGPDEGHLVVAFTGGKVAWVNATDGKITRVAASAEPIVSAPVVVGDQVALIGYGGNLLFVPVPAATAQVTSEPSHLVSNQ